MKSFGDLYDEADAKIDPKFISNYNIFTDARISGDVKSELPVLLSYLKYERETKNRQIIVARLFSLCWTMYKKVVAKELGIC